MDNESKKFSAARLRANEVMGPGNTDNFISPFRTLNPGDNVVLLLRVSIPQNEPHMVGQEIALRRACQKAGAAVSAIFFMS